MIICREVARHRAEEGEAQAGGGHEQLHRRRARSLQVAYHASCIDLRIRVKIEWIRPFLKNF